MATRIESGPRERAVEEGVDALGDGDLLALVLGTGRAGEPAGVLAAALLAEHGGLAGLTRAGAGALALRSGVGMAKGARIAAALELGRRAARDASFRASLRLTSSEAAAAWARPRLASLDHEELWVLVLDGHHGLRAARRVAMGGLHGIHVGVRDPLRIVLREGGSAFVLVHNHPSGEPAPSAEDVRFTHALARAADPIGTPLLDHVVVARGGSVSMLDTGLLDPLPAAARVTRPP